MSNLIHHLPQNATLAKAIIESFEIAEATCSIPSVFCRALSSYSHFPLY
jgi:hypothetical protein